MDSESAERLTHIGRVMILVLIFSLLVLGMWELGRIVHEQDSM